jgi:hypothetical protein
MQRETSVSCCHSCVGEILKKTFRLQRLQPTVVSELLAAEYSFALSRHATAHNRPLDC